MMRWFQPSDFAPGDSDLLVEDLMLFAEGLRRQGAKKDGH